jgi:anti-sigma B factor antagonist
MHSVLYWVDGSNHRRERERFTVIQDAHNRGSRNSTFGAEPFGVSARNHGGFIVLTVTGMVDMLTAPLLTEAITAALAEPPDGLVVDLSKVEFLGSAGMTVLVAADKQCTPPARFGVVATGRYTARPLHLVGLDEVISVYPTLHEALVDMNGATAV